MPDWIRRTALGDMLATDFTALADDALYRNLDRLHPQRARIERALVARERTLFNLDDTLYLYDLTSTYLKGNAGESAGQTRVLARSPRGLQAGRRGLGRGPRWLSESARGL